MQQKPDTNGCKFAKSDFFVEELPAIEELIERGLGISLSDIRDVINEKHGENAMSNKEVKLFMLEHFQERINFQVPEQKNESLMIFSASFSVEDVIQKL